MSLSVPTARKALLVLASALTLLTALAPSPALAGPPMPHFYKKCFASEEDKRDTLYQLSLIINDAEKVIARDEPKLAQVRRDLANLQSGGEPEGSAELANYNRTLGKLTDLEGRLIHSVKSAEATLETARAEFDRLDRKPICPQKPVARLPAPAPANDVAAVLLPQVLNLGLDIALEHRMRDGFMKERRMQMQDDGPMHGRGGWRRMMDFGGF